MVFAVDEWDEQLDRVQTTDGKIHLDLDDLLDELLGLADRAAVDLNGYGWSAHRSFQYATATRFEASWKAESGKRLRADSRAHDILRILSIVSFLYFGFSCLFSNGMVEEFERYGLSRFRRLVGAHKLLGAAGLLAGYLLPPVTVAAAARLSRLMLLGVATRIRVRDSLLETLPAILLLAASLYILFYALRS